MAKIPVKKEPSKNKPTYSHYWVGTIYQIECHKCGEMRYAGVDYCDTTGINQFLEYNLYGKGRRGCLVPDGAELCHPRSINRQQCFDFHGET